MGRAVGVGAVAVAAAVLGATAGVAGAGTIFHTCPGPGDRQNVCAVADTGTGPVKRVTRDGKSFGPSVSRNGARIAYQSDGDAVVATAAGKVLRRIEAQAAVSVSLPVISPDGRRVAWSEIAFLGFPTPSPVPYICVAAATGSAKPVCGGSFSGHVGWTAANRVVGAFDSDTASLCEVDMAPRPGDDSLFDDCVGPVVIRGESPTWPGLRPSFSPNGRLVVNGISPDVASIVTAISLYDARTGVLRKRLTTGTADSEPVFSPDGARVAFTRRFSIFVVKATGGTAKRLIAKGTHPAWSPK